MESCFIWINDSIRQNHNQTGTGILVFRFRKNYLIHLILGFVDQWIPVRILNKTNPIYCSP